MTTETPNETAPHAQEAPLDWANAQPDDIPAPLLKKHPAYRALQAERDALRADATTLWEAYSTVLRVISSIDPILKPLEAVHNLAVARLSPTTRVNLLNPPGSTEK